MAPVLELLYEMDAPHFQRVISKPALFSIPSTVLQDTLNLTNASPPSQPPCKKQRGIEKFLISTPRSVASSSTTTQQSPISKLCLVACIPDEHNKSVSIIAFSPTTSNTTNETHPNKRDDVNWTCHKLKQLNTNAEAPVMSIVYVKEARVVGVQTEKQCLVYKVY